MNLSEALTNVDQLCAVTASDLKVQMHDVCQQVLGKMAAKGLIQSNATIVAIKDALNGVINEKAQQLLAQYARILKATEALDYKTLPDELFSHARRHLDQHYSEGCHQLTDNEQRIHTCGRPSSGSSSAGRLPKDAPMGRAADSYSCRGVENDRCVTATTRSGSCFERGRIDSNNVSVQFSEYTCPQSVRRTQAAIAS